MKLFSVEILTPEHEFFSGQIQCVTLPFPDGPYQILAGHAPIASPLNVGSLRIRMEDGEEKTAFNSEGFVEVTHEGVLVFTQACEWPEQIDANRALAAKQRYEERLTRMSRLEPHSMHISLARAMERLRVKNNQKR